MTLVMSEIWPTSSLAATRGEMFLPEAVAGNTKWLKPLASASTCAATFSARPCAKMSASACSTLATPSTAAAALAAPDEPEPATRTVTAPPSCLAAVIVLSVAGRMPALSCSAMTSALISAMSDHLRFGLELGDERAHVGHLHACAALGRLAHLERLQVRLDVDPEVGGLEHVHLLLLRLHDVGQRHVARLVQAQVGRDDGRQLHLERLEAAVDLARDAGVTVGNLDLRCEGRLRQVGERRQHLASLVAIVVDRLLAENHQAGLFLVDE